MDWHADVRLLGMKKTRLEAMKKLLDQAAQRKRNAAADENKTAEFREELYINRLTTAITALNDEIFTMSQELGIDPKTGEIFGGADRECAANPG